MRISFIFMGMVWGLCGILSAAGAEGSKELFFYKYNQKDNTHPTQEGAAKFGETFLKEIKKQNLPISEIFK